MTTVPLKRLARLQVDPAVSDLPRISLESIESGTGRIVLKEDEPKETSLSGFAMALPGDILFGKLRPYLAKVWQADHAVAASTELLCLRPASEIDSRWLFYVLSSRLAIDWAVASSDGVKMPRTSWRKLGELQMVVPTGKDQRAIVRYLDQETARLDALIAAKSRINGLVEERFANRRENLLVNPQSARTVSLQDLADPRRPIVYGIVQAGPEVPGGVPYIKSGDVLNLDAGKLSRTSPAIDELYRRARVAPGDLVIAMRASIGALTRIPESIPMANLTQGTARIAPRNGVNVDWLFHVLQTRNVQQQCQLMAVGSTFKTLNIWDLRRLRVPTPSFPDQTRMAETIRALANTTCELQANLVEEIRLLVERRQALITAAVSDVLKVPGIAVA